MSGALRVAFVGRASEVGHAVPDAPLDGLHASFVEHRPGRASARLLAHIAEHDPEFVVVFGVDSIPSSAIWAIDVPVLAWAVAPDRPPGIERHPDLPFASARFRAGQAVARDYARVIDRPLPVADEHFAAAPRTPADPRALVIGHSSVRNEQLLIDSKHRHEVLHVAGGLRDNALMDVLARADTAINVRDDDGPGFGPRVGLYLAAGLLLLSEPLPPSRGLRPGTHYLEFRSSPQLVELLARVRANPAQFEPVRAAGRRAAEAFRASRVYPKLLCAGEGGQAEYSATPGGDRRLEALRQTIVERAGRLVSIARR